MMHIINSNGHFCIERIEKRDLPFCKKKESIENSFLEREMMMMMIDGEHVDEMCLNL